MNAVIREKLVGANVEALDIPVFVQKSDAQEKRLTSKYATYKTSERPLSTKPLIYMAINNTTKNGVIYE